MRTTPYYIQYIQDMKNCNISGKIYTHTHTHTLANWHNSVFTNGLGDWGSITDSVLPKTQKIVLDASLFNTQYYKLRFKGKE